MAKSKKAQQENIQTVIARSDDGTVQITFTIPYSQIEKTQKDVALEIGKDLEVPGFRKGNAPLKKLLEKIPKDTLLERTLSKILPKLLAKAIEENQIKPIIYPKFEIIKSQPYKDWEIRAVTAELLQFEIGDYKKLVAGISRAKSIWTPQSSKSNQKPASQSVEEKQNEVIKTLLENIKVTIPKILIEEEVTSRLSKLLEQIERLGLTLDSYLASIKKTPQDLRKEYEIQASNAIALDLILTRIAEKENFKVEASEIDAAIKVSSADTKLAEELDTPEKRKLIESILLKRKALNFLTSLT